MRLALIGLNYGLAYLGAIAATPGVELVALGARGSERSRAIATELGLPLHTDLPIPGIDAAIVAVPSDVSAALVNRLLAAGCSTLCEFPLEGHEVEEASRIARSTGACFAINPHFSHLPAPLAFIRRCRRAGPPTVVDVVCHERTLFPCLDTVRRAFGAPFVPSNALDRVVLGTIGPAPAVLRVTPLLSEDDDGSDVYFGQRISAGFAGRSLTLVDSFGPVLASRRSLLDLRAVSPPADVARDRTEANRSVLKAFVRACRMRPDRRPDLALLDVALTYTEIADRIAAPR